MNPISPLLANPATRLRGFSWLVLLVVASAVISYALACAAPFAALAAVAALCLNRKLAVLFILMTWAANQLIGFTLLKFPTDNTTLLWGVVLGGCSLAAVLFAYEVTKRTRIYMAQIPAMALTLIAAIIGFQFTLLLANLTSLGSIETFDLESKSQIIMIEIVAFVAMVAAERVAAKFGWFAAAAPVAQTA